MVWYGMVCYDMFMLWVSSIVIVISPLGSFSSSMVHLPLLLFVMIIIVIVNVNIDIVSG